MKTLKQIAQELNVPKTRIENWVKLARQEHPDHEIGTSQGNGRPKLYNDKDRDLILSYAPDQVKTPTPTPTPTGNTTALTTVSTGIVPSHVGLATDDQLSRLDSAIERFTPQQVELNGQQQTNLDGLNLLISAVDQATAINDQKQSELEQREQTVAKSEQVLELVKDKLIAEQKRNKTLNSKASDIAEREQAVNELLGKLGVS